MIKAILFDIDNTLIDFYNFKNKCVDAALDAMINAGLKIEKKKADKIIWGIHRQYGMEYEHIFEEFMKRTIKKTDYRILSHGLLAYRKARLSHLVPYPGVKSTIEKLKKKYKIAVLSDAPINKAWIRIVLMDIDDLLDVVITFDDTKKRKPHPLPFRKAIEKLKVKPSEILMV
jgi:putative hydrolase of the HAD superfamily